MNNDVLIINGSPRANGNTSYLVERAIEVFSEGKVSYEAITVALMNIKGCTACDVCAARKAKYCVFKDDMDSLYEKVLHCKSILFASPIDWFTYTAQLKAFVDRLYGLLNWMPNFLEGKRTGVILVYGDVDVYASGAINAISSFEHMMRYTKADLVGFAYGTAADSGDAAKNDALIEKTKELARKLL